MVSFLAKEALKLGGPLLNSNIMSKRKGRFGGMVPIDTLSPDSNHTSTPTRYTRYRKDPKVVDKVNHSLTKDFIPESRPSSSSSSSSAVSVKKRKTQNASGIKERIIGIENDEDVESLTVSTPPNTHKKRAGMLFLSPVDSNSSAVENKFLLSGSITTIDELGRISQKDRVIVHIVNDLEGTRCNVKSNGFELEGLQVDFLRDCDRFYFDESKSCMGIVLKYPRMIELGDRSGILNSKMVIITNSRSLDSNLDKVRILLLNSLVDVQVVGHKKDILEKMMETVTDEEKKASNRKFWEKPEFQSLGRHAKSAKASSGTKIGIPNSQELNQQTSPHSSPQGISTMDFYSASSSTSTTGTLRDHMMSRLRRTRQNTRTPTPDHVALDELEEDYEEPETFKPTLIHKFEDGSSFSVSNQDFKCLYNHDWINDSILDFFIKYWVEDAIVTGIIARDKVHVLSSFFYTKLVSDPENYYSNVKKWVNIDLFEKAYVVMPINVNFHWFGCIITNLDTVLDYLQDKSGTCDDNGAVKEKTKEAISTGNETPAHQPVIKIMIYDSLRQTHSREVDPIKEFLISYCEDKYGVELQKSQIQMKTCMVPQQPNMSDCGVHVILNTRKFFENPELTMEMWRSTKAKGKPSSRVINEFFEKRERNKARKNLRDVLLKLQKEQIEAGKSNGETSSHGEHFGSNYEDGEHSDIEIIEDYEAYQRLNNPQEQKEIVKNSTPLKDLKLNPGDEDKEFETGLQEESSGKRKLQDSEDSQRDEKERGNEETKNVISKGKDDVVSYTLGLASPVLQSEADIKTELSYQPLDATSSNGLERKEEFEAREQQADRDVSRSYRQRKYLESSPIEREESEEQSGGTGTVSKYFITRKLSNEGGLEVEDINSLTAANISPSPFSTSNQEQSPIPLPVDNIQISRSISPILPDGNNSLRKVNITQDHAKVSQVAVPENLVVSTDDIQVVEENPVEASSGISSNKNHVVAMAAGDGTSVDEGNDDDDDDDDDDEDDDDVRLIGVNNLDQESEFPDTLTNRGGSALEHIGVGVDSLTKIRKELEKEIEEDELEQYDVEKSTLENLEDTAKVAKPNPNFEEVHVVQSGSESNEFEDVDDDDSMLSRPTLRQGIQTISSEGDDRTYIEDLTKSPKKRAVHRFRNHTDYSNRTLTRLGDKNYFGNINR